jgi:SM-20-related protein
VKLDVYDDFFPKELYDLLLQKFANPWVLYGWKANDATDPHGHFNHDFTNTLAANLADVSDRLDADLASVWEFTKGKLGKDLLLMRSYLNAHTYGIEGYYHKDTIIPYKNTLETTMKTVVVYVVDGQWNRDWGGETAFAPSSNSPIHPAVLPAPNRVVVFGSDELHCARAVSRTFYGFRRTFMFKYREPGTPSQEKLSRFLYKHGAVDLLHSNKSSLHDHLLRVYSLLENKGLDRDSCFVGGLHSVYGTNAFKTKLFSSSDAVTAEFGRTVSDSVALFSDVKRPDQLERPEDLGDLFATVLDNNGDLRIVKRSDFDTLRLVEAANLIDQNQIKAYPNLIEAWKNR